jgi:hypothetical protein
MSKAILIDESEKGLPHGYRWWHVAFKPGARGHWYGVYRAPDREYDVVLVERQYLEDPTDVR